MPVGKEYVHIVTLLCAAAIPTHNHALYTWQDLDCVQLDVCSDILDLATVDRRQELLVVFHTDLLDARKVRPVMRYDVA